MNPSDVSIEVFLTPDQIRARVSELAEQITRDYAGQELLVVGILNGTILFLADLVREIQLDLHFDFVGLSSYRNSTQSGSLTWTKSLTSSPGARHILVVEDILDTGQTLSAVLQHLINLNPLSIKSCVLLEKMIPRPIPIHADYCGFHIPDRFVVGYGLDLAGQFRNLPYIGICHPKSPIPDSPDSTHHSLLPLTVEIQFWSHFKSITQCQNVRISLPPHSTLADAFHHVCQKFPALQPHSNSCLMAIGNEYKHPSSPLQTNDVISLFPPVQGG
jgi:hypoxanthine phosphoribosyltransferase